MGTKKQPKPRTATIQPDGKPVVIYEPAKTGRRVPCPGEAHAVGPGRANGHVDNCGLCAPEWGWVDEEAPIDFDAAKAAGQVVPFGYMSDEEYTRADLLISAGLAMHASVEERRKGCTSYYSVLLWT